MTRFKVDWLESVQRGNGIRGTGRNKLRTYSCFKNDFETELYCSLILPPRHRSAFCKFRCGVAPIRIETGRYENLPENERTCPFCFEVEDEIHVLFNCILYIDLRQPLISKAMELCNDFSAKSLLERLIFLFTHPDLVRLCAKTCFEILRRRSACLNKT